MSNTKCKISWNIIGPGHFEPLAWTSLQGSTRNGGKSWRKVELANPYVTRADECARDEAGCQLTKPYLNGETLTLSDPYWDIGAADGIQRRDIDSREIRYAISTIVNKLAVAFVIRSAWKALTGGNADSEPGTWKHFIAVAAPWLGFWMSYCPGVFAHRK
jgi:hypothetical protein